MSWVEKRQAKASQWGPGKVHAYIFSTELKTWHAACRNPKLRDWRWEKILPHDEPVTCTRCQKKGYGPLPKPVEALPEKEASTRHQRRAVLEELFRIAFKGEKVGWPNDNRIYLAAIARGYRESLIPLIIVDLKEDLKSMGDCQYPAASLLDYYESVGVKADGK